MKLTTSFLLLFIPACQLREKQTDFKEYENVTIGWSTKFPSSWHMMTDEEITKMEESGSKTMESATGQRIEINHSNLLSLKKDQFNSFTSNVQFHDAETDGSYKESQLAVTQAILEAYKAQGIQFDSKVGTASIDNLEFKTLETTLYTPDRSTIVLHQIMYERLFGGKNVLTLNINYNNEDDKAVLMEMLNSSRFSIRN